MVFSQLFPIMVEHIIAMMTTVMIYTKKFTIVYTPLYMKQILMPLTYQKF